MTRRLFAILSCLILLAFACGGPSAGEHGSETHFLKSCSVSCSDGLSCLCGVCTRACTTTRACQALSEAAECVPSGPRVADGSCAALEEVAFCDQSCDVDGDCSAFGAGYRCDAGYCRERPAGEPSPSCPRSPDNSAVVVVMGDAIIEQSSFGSALEAHARASGSLSPEAGFRNYATPLNSFLAGDTLSLAVQYDTARLDGPFEVVIMNGGETDMLQGTCGDAPSPDCAAIQAAVAGLDALLARMAGDGVRSVVYFFYADPVERPMVKAGLDALRPLAESSCAGAPLDCHFIDLRPVFEDHYTEYVASDGLVFSDAGAAASAEHVWRLMDAECIAW